MSHTSDNERSSHFLLGAFMGAILGVMFAPRSGKETRKKLKEDSQNLLEKGEELYEDAQVTYSLVKDKVEPVISEVMETAKPYIDKALEVSEPFRESLSERTKDFVEGELAREIKRLKKKVS